MYTNIWICRLVRPCLRTAYLVVNVSSCIYTNARRTCVPNAHMPQKYFGKHDSSATQGYANIRNRLLYHHAFIYMLFFPPYLKRTRIILCCLRALVKQTRPPGRRCISRIYASFMRTDVWKLLACLLSMGLSVQVPKQTCTPKKQALYIYIKWVHKTPYTKHVSHSQGVVICM